MRTNSEAGRIVELVDAVEDEDNLEVEDDVEEFLLNLRGAQSVKVFGWENSSRSVSATANL